MDSRDAVENHWLNARSARTTRAIKIQGVSRVLGTPGPDGPSEPGRRGGILSLSGMITSWHRPAPMTGSRPGVVAADAPRNRGDTLRVHGTDRARRPGAARAVRARRAAAAVVPVWSC